ncbi:MAG TPA: rRNA pseudouridine synthase [Anaerolineae bacterium]|nr:rRNA pseudouridine synthase [Anaerolineae bacterium]HID85558.1 rRNA pseudouridine synthase [Anaerolineales bacterium]HIQ08446.1 rRNA pseudouridine synthase [Anaerolineaceae bacterium]
MSMILLFNKPYGVLSAFTDPEGRPTLAQYIPLSDVYPAGRLDLRSEGLLLLTDDGAVAHRLTHPRYKLPKTYWVQVEGVPNDEQLNALREGVFIKGGYRTRPAKVQVIPPPPLPPRPKPVTPHGPTTWLQNTLTEGKKHQVRHMTAAVGLPTLRLFRWRIGPFTAVGLRPGQWRALTPGEERTLRRALRLRTR